MISLGIRSVRRARVAALSLLLAAGLGLAACGGDDDGAEEPATTTENAGNGANGDVRSQVEEFLRQSLTADRGMSEEQADCVIDALQKSVSDAQIEQFLATGQPPAAVTRAAAEAGRTCADAGG
jgi:hypothetical protein